MKRLFIALAAIGVLGAAAPASAQFMYGGLHPVNPAVGGGFCYNNSAHSHPYGTDQNVSYLYRNVGGYQYFVGDPYHFGYQGQAFPYYGHHPLPNGVGASYCYLDGAHYHHFLPPAAHAAYYVVNNGHYYYQGGLPAWYYTYRNNYYRRYHSYWYLPAYRGYYSRYRTFWRSYARPAHLRYFRNRPRIVYRYRRPPVRRLVSTAWRRGWARTRPVYRYRPSFRRHNPRATVYRRPAVRTYRTRTYRTRTYRTRTYRPSSRRGGSSYRRGRRR